MGGGIEKKPNSQLECGKVGEIRTTSTHCTSRPFVKSTDESIPVYPLVELKQPLSAVAAQRLNLGDAAS